MQTSRYIFVFVGPNGAGRKTVAEMAGSTLGIKQVLSYTTRKPRPGEADGQHYHFVSREAFEKAEQNGEFIETMEYEGNLYGVKREDIEQALKSRRAIYLVLSRHGGDVLKRTYGDRVVRIFIYVDLQILIDRHRKRGDSEEDIQHYIAHYDEEMAYKAECEHAFENIDLAHTVFDISKTLDSYLDRNLLELD
jgi:guanylate kinase